MKWLIATAVIWLAWHYLGPASKSKARPATRRMSRVAPLSGSELDAQHLLGVPADSDEQAIREAYRRRIAEVHPDRGGSDAVTRELNAARDLLLARLRSGQ